MAGQFNLDKMRTFYEYDACKSGRELAYDRLGMVLKELRKHLGGEIKRQRILDVGVSDGYLIKRIRRMGVFAYGIDIAFSMLEIVTKNILPEERPIFLIHGFVTQLPFADGSFDMITACEILEHLDENGLREALRELYRTLAPGGHLFVTTPYNEQIADSYVKCPECEYIFPPSGHYCSFNEDKWRSFKKDIGFSEVSIKKIYGTDFRLKKLNFCKPLIEVMARLFSVDSLTKMLVIIRK